MGDWLVQNGLPSESCGAFTDYLGDRAVMVDYFDGTVDRLPALSPQAVVYGSTEFVGWAAGSCQTAGLWPNLRFGAFDWPYFWGRFCFNWDARQVLLGDLPGLVNYDGWYFVRPEFDGKLFAGSQVQGGAMRRFVEELIARYPKVEAGSKVVYSVAKEVGAEYRVWLVDGVAVSVSRCVNEPVVAADDGLLAGVAAFGEHLFGVWTPEPVVVFDVCGPPWRLLEVNSFNCSGLYCDASVGAIAEAVERFAVS